MSWSRLDVLSLSWFWSLNLFLFLNWFLLNWFGHWFNLFCRLLGNLSCFCWLLFFRFLFFWWFLIFYWLLLINKFFLFSLWSYWSTNLKFRFSNWFLNFLFKLLLFDWRFYFFSNLDRFLDLFSLNFRILNLFNKLLFRFSFFKRLIIGLLISWFIVVWLIILWFVIVIEVLSSLWNKLFVFKVLFSSSKD